jgi:hypothetical protein
LNKVATLRMGSMSPPPPHLSPHRTTITGYKKGHSSTNVSVLCWPFAQISISAFRIVLPFFFLSSSFTLSVLHMCILLSSFFTYRSVPRFFLSFPFLSIFDSSFFLTTFSSFFHLILCFFYFSLFVSSFFFLLPCLSCLFFTLA